MEIATPLSEGTVEQEEAIIPCKGCGDVLEEGKAFELAGNRWHIDCFRCNSCHTLLDSDANLLLLGDGSLICNNCTYSCTVCHNKIEDLAILTGEQAFCAKCFKCRNCKRKIENLKYAKTSQGIFCMQCHESLMARRKKKSKTTVRRTSATQVPPVSSAGTVTDKSLPALPPHIAPTGAFSPDDEPLVEHFDPATGRARTDSTARNHKAAMPSTDYGEQKENILLSPRAYGDDQAHSLLTTVPDDEFTIPVGLDPSSAIPLPTQINRQNNQQQTTRRDYFGTTNATPASTNAYRNDLITSSRSGSMERNRPLRRADSPQSAFQEKGRVGSSDNIERLQHRSRGSGQSTPRSSNATPALGSTERFNKSNSSHSQDLDATAGRSVSSKFKLQEAPKRKSPDLMRNSPRSESPSGNVSSAYGRTSPIVDGSYDLASHFAGLDRAHSPETANLNNKQRSSFKRSPLSSPVLGQMPFERPVRDDSMRKPIQHHATNSSNNHQVPRKEVPWSDYGNNSNSNSNINSPSNGLVDSPQAPSSAPLGTITRQESFKGKSISRPSPSNLSNSVYDSGLPTRSPRRPFAVPTTTNTGAAAAAAATAASVDDYMDMEIREGDFSAPRVPPPIPPPPADLRHRQNESAASNHTSESNNNYYSKEPGSPSLTQYVLNDTYDDDLGRDQDGEDQPGLFRKMSKAVRHGRSHSDKIGVAASPRWGGAAKGSRNASVDISSPLPSATGGEGEGSELRNKLRYSQQRVAELEAEKLALQEQVNGTEDIRQVNSELRQKRSTMAVLDTQREMVVRELEVMTNQLQNVKNNNGPINLDQIRSDAMRDFAAAMEKLKINLANQIEELIARKNDLTNEISTLIQMKDKGFQEYESLSTKNHQLAEHNNQLVQSIQELYRQGKQPSTTSSVTGVGMGAAAIAAATAAGATASPNGLGIYPHHNHTNHKSDTSFDLRSTTTHDTSYSQLSGDTEIGEQPTIVLQGPQLVNMRKAQPAKKFINWKKGKETAKNVGKGFKGAFASTQQPNSNLREEQFAEGIPYSSMQADVPPTTGALPLAPSRAGMNNNNNNEQSKQQAWHFLSEKGRGAIGAPIPQSAQQQQRPGMPLQSLSSTSSPSAAAMLAASSPGGGGNIPSAETTLFGSDLTARCEFEKSVIPTIVMSCIDQVSLRGLDQEGVYRKSGSSTQVRTIQAGFEKDYAGYDISDTDLDIHAVTGTLKQYFRRLPNPLITFESYDDFLDAVTPADTPESVKVRNLQNVIRQLPKCHRETLEFLCFHLVAVMEKSDENLMSPLNLAVVFAPTIMRPLAIEREITDTHLQRGAVQCMLENFHAIFQQDREQ